VTTQALFTPAWSDLGHFLPETALIVAFLAALLGDLLSRRRPAVPFAIALVGMALAFGWSLAALGEPEQSVLGNLVAVDGMAGFFRVLFSLVGLLTLLLSWPSEEIMGPTRENKGEYYALVSLVTAAMMVMAEARDLLMLYLSLETVSITSYVMAGYLRSTLRSTEASVKYLIFGAVSSGIMLYGLSLMYGLAGTLSLDGIRAAMAARGAPELSLLVVTVLVLAGMGYKISMVPFHFWTPDVYEGAPTPITAFFSVGPKAAGFALLVRFFYTCLTPVVEHVDWPALIAILSAVTMTYGNVVAVRQTNVKRMLAYSSIAHVGYLLMGFLMLTGPGLQAILFYLFVYALMNLGAFIFVVAVNNTLGSEELVDYAGLGYKAPWAAAAMVVFLVSLTGLPPTAGFVGKFYLFAEVVRRGYYWLAIVGVLNSVISLYYYFLIAKAMYFTPAAEGSPETVPVPWLHHLTLGFTAASILVLAVYWSPLKDMADAAIAASRLVGG